MSNNNMLSIKIREDENEIERLAILLAMTETKEEEKEYIEKYKEAGYLAAVTGIAGMDSEIHKKMVNAVIGAGLNEGVIEKKLTEMHAIVHATAEASRSMKADSPVSQSFQLKGAIVKKGGWLCVAMYGNMAIHKITNHKTIGLGVMHI